MKQVDLSDIGVKKSLYDDLKTPDVNGIIVDWGNNLITALRDKLAKNKSNASGSLSADIKPVIRVNPKGLNYIVLMNDYYIDVEEGQDYIDLYTKGILTNDEVRQELGFEILSTAKVASSLNDAINSLSPLVANNVLSNMTVNEKRQLAGLPPIQGGDALGNSPVAMSKITRDEDVLSLFAKCGVSKDECEVVKFEFATASETAILQILNANEGITVGEIAKYVNIDAQKVMDAITKMIDDGLINSDNGKLSTSTKGIKELAKSVDTQIELRYEYGLDAAFLGEPELIDTSRDFCRQLIGLNRYYTRKEIDTISSRVDRDVWKERGGWYTIPDTTIHINHCRHAWNSKLVRKKL